MPAKHGSTVQVGGTEEVVFPLICVVDVADVVVEVEV